MIEAFYSGAAGLRAHQTALDITSNNIANLNTTAYKTKDGDFSSLLGSSMLMPAARNAAQAIAYAGGGVLGVQDDMSSGSLEKTDADTDYAVEGDGFFAAREGGGAVVFTRDGHFHKDGTGALVTAQGYAVLDSAGNPATGIPGVYTFANASGLTAQGDNLYAASLLSGAPAPAAAAVKQGYLESSNVDLAGQMAQLILVQRGLQLNARTVTTADDLEGMVNDLSR